MGSATGEAYANTLASTGMHPSAVLGREAIQNSVDARLSDSEKVLVRFRSAGLSGPSKRQFVRSARLDSIAMRRTHLELPTPNCLGGLNDSEQEIRLLFVEDFHTTGLIGDPHNASSNFHRLLLSLGDSSKARDDQLTGGSFGFGKSAYSSVSAIFTIFAYTRFLAASQARSRLFGCAYFRSHTAQGVSHTGRAWLGVDQIQGDGEQVVDPFSGRRADVLAEALGFTPRSASDLGTSILIVDTAIEIPDIVRGVEDWWWPRLIDQLLDVEGVKPDGSSIVPRPRLRPDLRPFIEAYELAIGRNPNPLPRQEDAFRFNRFEGREVGVLGLKVLDASEDEVPVVGEERVDTIALIRQPRMVVAYHRPGYPGTPPVIGALLADAEIDGVLKLSEPPPHDRWDPESTRLRDTDGFQQRLVQSLISRIRNRLKQFQSAASPPPPPRPRRLSVLERALARFFSGGRGARDRPEPSSAPIHLAYDRNPEIHQTNDGRLRLEADFSIRLKDEADRPERLRLSVECRVLEDGTEGDDVGVTVSSVGATLEPDPSSTSRYIVSLSRGEAVKISAVTRPYDPLCTVRFRPEVEPLGAE